MIIKRLLATLLLAITMMMVSGCQQTTRQFGGTSTIDLPPGKRLVPYTVQWEGTTHDIWYLVEDAPADYVPKTYEFKESSNIGALQGEVVFVEHKAGDTNFAPRKREDVATQAKNALKNYQENAK